MKKRKLRGIPGGRAHSAPPVTLKRTQNDPDARFFRGLSEFVRLAVQEDPTLTSADVLSACMRFTASIGVTVAAEMGGTGTEYADACHLCFEAEETARSRG